ncbi:MAG: chitosanase [Chthoniobacteraceae bacterium]|nr:chitosanase [Chthoniobacteraceae bacterium]
MGLALAIGAGGAAASPKHVIQELTSIFENSTPELQYTFVKNIGDQRGYTFGFTGFTSGTFSGTIFLKEYQRLRPGNALVRFLPAFRKIDAGPHDSAGRNPSTEGLDAFPEAFRACGGDPVFRRAQRNVVDRLAWNPALAAARRIGAQRPLTLGQLYDAYVNHGEDGIRSLIGKANRRCGGMPRDGVSESRWLDAFLRARLAVLKADPTWAQAVDRIAVYRKLLRERNFKLRLPIAVDCYGNHFLLK